MSDPNQLLTIAQAARLVGVSRQAIFEALEREALEAVSVVIHQRRVRRADVIAYARRTRKQAGRPTIRPTPYK